jgi:IclR family pca regulon transcriptional regulator
LSDDEIRHHLDAVPMQPLTAHTLTDVVAVTAAIRQAKAEGYALSYDELEVGMCSMAVPVRGRSGTIEAAISVSAFSGRVSRETLTQSFLPALQRVAQRVQRALYHGVCGRLETPGGACKDNEVRPRICGRPEWKI